jgi:cytochrome c2
MKFVVFLSLSMFMYATTAYADDVPAGDAVHGRQIYDTICIHCHHLTDEKSVVGAPGFKGVKTRHSKDWMNHWIHGPEAFAKKNDAAKKLIESNKMGVIMPTFPEMQIDKNRYDVIEFLQTL